jgi:Domain of unknown function (DUF4372)
LSPNKILRSAVPYLPTAFHRLVEPLDRQVVERIVARHYGNRGVWTGEGARTCQRHLKTLLFAQIAGLQSLGEIEQATAARAAISLTSERPRSDFKSIVTDFLLALSIMQ